MKDLKHTLDLGFNSLSVAFFPAPRKFTDISFAAQKAQIQGHVEEVGKLLRAELDRAQEQRALTGEEDAR